MYYPEELVEEVRLKNDIVDVISGYVKLQKKGSSHFGLCPFHNEKSPSFSVSRGKQMYYCFGCGAGGNVFTFLMEYENYSFQEALKVLADRAGVELPKLEYSKEAKEKAELKTILLEVNKLAAKYFYVQLKSEQGRAAYTYLKDRKLSDETITAFGLGYSNKYSDDLYRYLKTKGYTDEVLLKAGLISADERHGAYDKFWNRVMFPIMDANNRVIGFGGRVMGDGKPKYLNSPETPVFDKSRNLYGLHRARISRKPYFLICEGYMDVVSVHQGGFDNAVATLGTALTPEQARLISNYTDTVVLSYDSDGPGQQATRRAISIFEDTGVKVRVLSIPDAKDPDEFLKKFGPERFALLLEGSSGAMDFEVEKLRKKYDTDIPEGRVGFLQEFVRLLAGLSSPIQREVYLSKVCRELEVDKQAVAHQLEGAIRRRKAGQEKRDARELRPFTARQASARTDLEKQKYPRFVLAEERLIAYLIRSPSAWDWVSQEIAPEEFISPRDREIYEAVAGRLSQGLTADMMSLSGELTEENLARLSEILASPGCGNISAKEAEDYIGTLKSFYTQKTSEEVGNMEAEDFGRYIASIAAKKK